MFHQRGKPFQVNSLTWRNILTGSPLPREIVPVVARTELEGFACKYTTVLDEEDKVRAILHGRGKKRRR